MPRVLITGSKGFVGSRVVELLSDKGYQVVACSEDIRNKEALRPYFPADFVVHAAGQVKTISEEEIYYATNILGTANVAELCLEYGCKLIHLSSIETKGAYGLSKQVSQTLIEKYYSKLGLEALILRLCVVMEADTEARRRHKIAWCQVDDLASEIEEHIRTNDFSECRVIDYKELKK